MSTLVAVIFKHDENGATNTLTKLRQLEKEYLIDLEDAVIVRRGKGFLGNGLYYKWNV